MEIGILLAVLLGIVVLLALILGFKLPAFISLLIASIVAGIAAGLDAGEVMDTVKNGMASTLGFVATVVGLGAMFGAILEHSGGAKSIANYLINKLGEERAPMSMVITGFVVAIPVFFDVAFIILVPVIYALQKRTGKSLLLYAIPLLAGLAITHAFIPPTPGPVAVADIIQADLGWVILLGILAGIPTAICSGLLFGKYIGKEIYIDAPMSVEGEQVAEDLPPIGMIIAIIAVPIVLILFSTFTTSGLISLPEGIITEVVGIIGHPFGALIIANLLVWYLLGLRRGFAPKTLLNISSKSMETAGTIILLTGAGGVFKQVLVDTGAGKMIAESLNELGFPLIVFAFLAAVLIRIIQGSATVAMITAAGLVAPLISIDAMSAGQLAAIVIAIAAGASTFSHVNDSGFWLVKQYLGLDEKQTFRSWTMMTTILSLTGFVMSVILFVLF